MNKLQMAHDFAMKCKRPDLTLEGVVSLSWRYADAMQAEADKRKKEESNKQKIKCDEKIEINMYPEYDETINYPPDAWVMYRGEKRLAVSIKEEWQPDWSQAPDWANWWAMDADRKCHWFSKEPDLHNGVSEYILGNNGEGLDNIFLPSLDDEYTGDWRDSLRKRPE